MPLLPWFVMIFILFRENVMPRWATVTLAPHRSEVEPTIAASRHIATLHCKVREAAGNRQLRLSGKGLARLTLRSYHRSCLRSELVQLEAYRKYF